MKKLDRTGWEVVILIAFVITLPLVEAPKNILWVIFVVTWFVNRKATGNWGGKWDGWDTLFAAWIGIFTLGTFFAGISGEEWKGLRDPIQYITLFWLIKRSSYSPRQITQIVIAITAATLIGLPTAYWHAFVTHSKPYLELNSVGHSNHSAIYLLISFGILLAFTLAFWKELKIRYRSLATATLVIFALSIILSQSRAAAGVMFMLVILVSFAWWPRSKKLAISLTAMLITAIVAVIIISPPVLEEQKRYERSNALLSTRIPIWNTAILAWREYPLFGIGARNYSRINEEDIKAWAMEKYGEYKPKHYQTTGLSHTHNLYITTLAERGITGLVVVLVVLGAIGWKLLRHRPKESDENIYWALWAGALSTWFTQVSIGLVNTTLHHEHALLAIIIVGLYLRYSAQRVLSPTSKVQPVS